MPRRRDLLKLLLLVVIVAGAVWAASRIGLLHLRDPSDVADTVRAAREIPGIGAIFFLVFAGCAAVGMPLSVLSMIGGAIFGVPLGMLLNWLGGTVGATLAYGLARGLGGPAVLALLGRRGAALRQFATVHGFTTLLRLRVLPVIPYNALSFSAGLAGMRVRDFVLATAIGIVPAIFIYTFFADALIAGIAGARRRAFLHAAVAGLGLLLLSLIPALARRFARRRGRDPRAGAGPAAPGARPPTG